ncbi:T9SS type B sorting domain-containing protein [Dokdonia sp. Asnod3-C12]|uniref:T9SS type B sorting domain-containing protein n=1 Tax=Dokdonia sp. Asnod3-C12 TaxID=3160575 RepID=UPI00386C992E
MGHPAKTICLFLLFSSYVLFGQTSNDCLNSIQVCGSLQLGIEPAGIGFDEFSLPNNTRPSCFFGLSDTIWLRFTFVSDGTFGFSLNPTNNIDDYDFAVYGPTDDCSLLGDAIRCSTTNPQAAGVPAATGLSTAEPNGDVSEGPGADGDGFLSAIDVFAGQTYYVFINRAIGNESFDIITTGTAQLPETPTINPTPDQELCDLDGPVDERTIFDLATLIPSINNQNNIAVTFHESLDNVSTGTEPLDLNYMNVTNPQTLYYRVENNISGCFNIGSFDITVSTPFSITLPENLQVCTNQSQSALLTTESNYAFYEWSNGESGAELNQITINEPGDYSVIVTDNNGCRATSNTIVTASSTANITEISVTSFEENNNTAIVNTEGLGEYEYAIDTASNFQDSNTFTGLTNDYYDFYVRDKNGCGTVTKRQLILDYPRYFTPNGDGYHDEWKIIGIGDIEDIASIYIFDRYGKLLKQLSPQSSGWNGIYRGKLLPSSDYWFLLKFNNREDVAGHFLLKR